MESFKKKKEKNLTELRAENLTQKGENLIYIC